MTPEQLIAALQDKVEKLEDELTQAQKDIVDFEELALIWKKALVDMERDYKVSLANAKQTIEELQKELEESKYL